VTQRSAAWLLLLVAFTHYAADPLSAWLGFRAATWFYVLRGLEGAALFWLLRRLSPARAWRWCCTWGAVEEMLTAGCGAAMMLRPVYPGPFQGLCDAQTGLPLYQIGVAAAAVLAWITARGLSHE
jgi:hypothetical protein